MTRPVVLRTLAKATGLPLADLEQLNPELRLGLTPPDDPEYRLKVPVGTKAAVERVLPVLPAWKPSAVLVKHPASRGRPQWYHVRVGDTLRSIARRTHHTVQELRSLNHLSASRLKPGDRLTLSPLH